MRRKGVGNLWHRTVSRGYNERWRIPPQTPPDPAMADDSSFADFL